MTDGQQISKQQLAKETLNTLGHRCLQIYYQKSLLRKLTQHCYDTGMHSYVTLISQW